MSFKQIRISLDDGPPFDSTNAVYHAERVAETKRSRRPAKVRIVHLETEDSRVDGEVVQAQTAYPVGPTFAFSFKPLLSGIEW